jgi:hypothetical protein
MIAEQHGMSREFVFDASKLALSQEIRGVQLCLSAQEMGKLQFHNDCMAFGAISSDRSPLTSVLLLL